MIGRREHRAEHAAVGDRERAAGQLLDRELALLRALAEVGDRLLDLGERQLVGVAQDRHHQPARAAHRDADVEVAVVDDVVAVDRGVHHRELLQRVHRRLDEERHEAELHAVLLLEALLVAVAQIHHRLHVDLVEGREDRRGRLRLRRGARRRARAAATSARAARGGCPWEDLEAGRRARASRPEPVPGLERLGAALAASTSPLVTRPSRPATGDRGGVDALLGRRSWRAEGEAAFPRRRGRRRPLRVPREPRGSTAADDGAPPRRPCRSPRSPRPRSPSRRPPLTILAITPVGRRRQSRARPCRSRCR